MQSPYKARKISYFSTIHLLQFRIWIICLAVEIIIWWEIKMLCSSGNRSPEIVVKPFEKYFQSDHDSPNGSSVADCGQPQGIRRLWRFSVEKFAPI